MCPLARQTGKRPHVSQQETLNGTSLRSKCSGVNLDEMIKDFRLKDLKIVEIIIEIIRNKG